MTPLTIACLSFGAVLFALGALGVVVSLVREYLIRRREPELIVDLRHVIPVVPRPLSKDEAECCKALDRLDDGRPVIGYCGPDCIRRPKATV